MNRRSRAFAQMTMFHFRELYRNKIAMFFNLLFPLVFVVIFGALFRVPDRHSATPVGFINHDRGPVAEAVSQAMTGGDLFRLHDGDLGTLNDSLKSGKIRAIVVLPAGLSEQTIGPEGAEPTAVEIVHDPLSPASSRAAAELRTVLNGLGVRMTGVHPAFVAVARPLQGSSQRDVFDYLMPGMMTMMLLASGLMTVSVTVAEQRGSGALRHLFSTPMSVGVWTAGRVCGNLLMAFVQGVLLFTFARVVFGVGPPVNLPGTLVVVSLSTFMILGIGLIIGSWAKNEDTAVAASMPVLMVLMFLGNAAMPLEDPPAFIAAILRWVPTFHITEALRAVMRDGQGLGSVAGELMLITGLAAMFLGVAIWRMRRQFVLAAD